MSDFPQAGRGAGVDRPKLAQWLVAAVVASLAPGPAAADKVPAPTVVLEVHSLVRPEGMDDRLSRLLKALGDQAPMHGEALGKQLDARVSLNPGPAEEARGLRAEVKDGRRLFIEGRFKQAIPQLEKALAELMRHTAVVAADQGLRTSFQRALLFLAHSYLRTRQKDRATERIREAIRSFPDKPPSRVEYSPELTRFYKMVRRQMLKKRGTLEVTTTPGGCLVFVNERYVGMSPVTVPGLYEGRYRVYVQQPRVRGRVHHLEMAGGEQKLHVNFGLDSALVSAPWVGLLFDSQEKDNKYRLKYARAIAQALEAPAVMLVGVSSHRGLQSLKGEVLASSTGEVVRSAMLALEPNLPGPEDFSAMGRFLVAGTPDQALVITVPEGLAAPSPEAAAAIPVKDDEPEIGGNSRAMGISRWVTLGVAVGGLAAGIPLMVIDGHKTCGTPEAVGCPENYATMAPGVALTVVGGLSAVASTVLFVLHARKERQRALQATAVSPWLGGRGGGVSAAFSF